MLAARTLRKLLHSPEPFPLSPNPFKIKPISSLPTPNSHDLINETENNSDVSALTSLMLKFPQNPTQTKTLLTATSLTPTPPVVSAVLARLRHDHSAAHTFYLWAVSHPDFTPTPQIFNSVLAVLAKARRFDTAWSLLHAGRGTGLVSPQALMVVVRRYAAVHDVANAIGAFYQFRKFGFELGVEAFHGLLSALCRYKNVEEAEHLLLCNEKTFPFETKSFNIVLNGWCSVLVVVREAKRFWKSMDSKEIEKDVVSYGSMMTCYSKAGNLKDVLKVFDEMKQRGIEPDRKVYNALVYALAKGKCMKEARDIVKTMKEKGIVANAVTFNSLIRPLCKAKKVEEAKGEFDEMLRRGLRPSIRTFHSFLRTSKTEEEMFELLGIMKRSDCEPEVETYIMLIRRLCRRQQYEKVYDLWNDLRVNGPGPNRSAYIVLIHGLFLNGKLVEAHKYYEEMKSKGFLPEPKTEEMIQAWLSGKGTDGSSTTVEESDDKKQVDRQDGMEQRRRDSLRPPGRNKDYLKPELKNVSRERGFSLG